MPKSRIDTLIWSPANTLNLQDIWNPFATPNGVARYTVMAIDTNNCRDSAEIWINVIHPDVFIPMFFHRTVMAPMTFSLLIQRPN